MFFVAGSLLVSESPRWLFRRGRKDKALAALLRSRTPQQAAIELREMEETANVLSSQRAAGQKVRESAAAPEIRDSIPAGLRHPLLQHRHRHQLYIGYNTGILLQSGLSDLQAHWGYVVFTFVNFLMTMVGMTLVDRKGRRFLMILGTSGIIVSMLSVGAMFLGTEKASVDCRNVLQAVVGADQALTVHFDQAQAERLLAAVNHTGGDIRADRASFAIIYSYGDFTASTSYVRSDDPGAAALSITRASCVPANKVDAFFKNPVGNLDAARTAPLVIKKALIGGVPDPGHGWLVALCLYAFVAFYASGPGVCVWLALSELMPTRIRSNGMSVALVLNQLVSTTLAAIFLPFVSKYGYSSMFFLFAGFTVIYFLTVTFLLPETKGKTLEEIEAHFAGQTAG